MADSKSPKHPTTTHARWGAGRPRLIFKVGSVDWDGAPAREFALRGEVTEIGSAEGADLRLEGIEPQHARIVHEADDEYVLYSTSPVGKGSEERADDRSSWRHVLRTGAPVQIGSWSMSFARDERADHGRPHGGRVGGELAIQQGQPDRPDYPESTEA